MIIKIRIPEDSGEFDSKERMAIFIAIRTLCDNMGTDGIKCSCNTLIE